MYDITINIAIGQSKRVRRLSTPTTTKKIYAFVLCRHATDARRKKRKTYFTTAAAAAATKMRSRIKGSRDKNVCLYW